MAKSKALKNNNGYLQIQEPVLPSKKSNFALRQGSMFFLSLITHLTFNNAGQEFDLFMYLKDKPSPTAKIEIPNQEIQDFIITKSGFVYLITRGNHEIHVMNIEGKSDHTLTLPNPKLHEFTAIDIIDEQIIVADAKAKSLHTFSNKQYIKSIPIPHNISPRNLAVVDDKLYCSGYSVGPYTGDILVFNKNIQFETRLSPPIPPPPYTNQENKMWERVELQPFEDNLLIGYLFQNKAFIIGANGEILHGTDLSHIYPRYETEVRGKIIPDGFAASDFLVLNHHNTYVVACDNNKRSCDRIIHLNSLWTESLAEFNFGTHIWQIDYYPEHKLICIITGTRDLQIYKHL